ncbi:hypothetical protein D9M72_549570 [compost metagenome]
MQGFADARATGPILDRRDAFVERDIRVAISHRPRNIGQPCAEEEGVNALAFFTEGVEEMQEDAGVLAH